MGDAGGSIVVVADSVEDADVELARFSDQYSVPVQLLAISRQDTPEFDSLRRAATTLHAKMTSGFKLDSPLPLPVRERDGPKPVGG